MYSLNDLKTEISAKINWLRENNLISEIHDHGWPTAKKLLPIIAESEKVSRAQRPAS